MKEKPIFLCDAMLAKLARWLRIFGYDTELASPRESDEKILERARLEVRILLTRDKELARHRDVLLVPETPIEQIKFLIRKLGITISEKPVPLYCSTCNGRLRIAKPEELPKFVNYGWVCTECGQQYWEGSHWKGVKRFVDKIKAGIKKEFLNPSHTL